MAIEQRCEALRRKHAAIEDSLREEEKHLWHNEANIHQLKVEKMHIKEELDRLSVQAA